MADDLGMRRAVISTVILTPLCLATLALLSGCQDEAKGTQAQITQKTPVLDSRSPASGATASQNMVPVAQQAPAAGPRITFEKTTHDFGDVVPGNRYAVEFKFRNTGTAPLKILSVQPCCGTVIKGVEDGQVFAPGRGGTLEWEYVAADTPGTVTRNTYVKTNDPAQDMVHLSFKADVAQQISCDPPILRLFLRRENGGAGDLTVTSCTGEPFSITSFKSTGECVTTKIDPNAKDTKFVLKLTADVEKLKKHERGRIEILMTHPGKKALVVDYDVLPEFTISPPQIFAFNLKPGEPVQKEIWVLPNYDNDFEIESVTSESGKIRLVSQEKVKQAPTLVVGMAPGVGDAANESRYQYRLKVELVPPQDRAPISDRIRIAVKGGETLSVEFRGYY